jgi:hypothetical protein
LYAPAAEYLPAGHAMQCLPSDTYPGAQQRPSVQLGKKDNIVE